MSFKSLAVRIHKNRYGLSFHNAKKKDDESVEVGRVVLNIDDSFQYIYQFHSALYDPRAVLELDDEASERMEFISIESLKT